VDPLLLGWIRGMLYLLTHSTEVVVFSVSQPMALDGQLGGMRVFKFIIYHLVYCEDIIFIK
jgi:hypothetical protein